MLKYNAPNNIYIFNYIMCKFLVIYTIFLCSFLIYPGLFIPSGLYSQQSNNFESVYLNQFTFMADPHVQKRLRNHKPP